MLARRNVKVLSDISYYQDFSILSESKIDLGCE